MQKERNTGLNASSSTSKLWHPNEQRKEFDRRVIALTKDFQELAGEAKQSLDKLDLAAYFKNKGIFDAHRLDVIFEILDENKDGIITKNEYIKKCLEVEDNILFKLNEKVSNLNSFKSQYEETVKKLAVAKEEEVVNRFGIMQNSTLRVGVIEARGLLPKDLNGTVTPYAVVTVGTQSRSTKRVSSTLAPAWNEELTFDVETGEELVKIAVMSKELIGPDNFHGFTTINLVDLRDQLIHELWLDLQNLEGRTGVGKIHLSFQWIHSHVTFYADLLTKIQARILSETEAKRSVETALENFKEPCGAVRYVDIVQTFSSAPTGQREGETGRSLALTPSVPIINRSIALTTPHDSVMTLSPPEEFLTTENACWLFMVSCATLSFFRRADFLNLCVGLLGLARAGFNAFYKQTDGSAATFGKIVVVLYVALAYDVLWILSAGYSAVLVASIGGLFGLLLFISGIVIKMRLVTMYKEKAMRSSATPFLTPPPGSHHNQAGIQKMLYCRR